MNYQHQPASAGSPGVFGMDISLDRASNHTTATATERVVTERARVRLYGELDLAHTATLRVVLTELHYSGFHHVALDLSALDFLGAAGVGALGGAVEEDTAAGDTLTLDRPSRCAHRVLAVCRLSQLSVLTPLITPEGGPPPSSTPGPRHPGRMPVPERTPTHPGTRVARAALPQDTTTLTRPTLTRPTLTRTERNPPERDLKEAGICPHHP